MERLAYINYTLNGFYTHSTRVVHTKYCNLVKAQNWQDLWLSGETYYCCIDKWA